MLQCANCQIVVGSSQTGEYGFRLYKSRLAVKITQDQVLQDFPPDVFICGQLLSLIESSVSRKIVLHQDTHANAGSEVKGLLLWIFNPDIYYSSSKRGPTAHRAMKIFYKSISKPEEFLDEHNNTHEELVVPPEDFEDFKTILEESTTVLPLSARKFQDWGIGLIDRWEKHATGTSKMDENPLNKKVEDGFELFKLPAGMQELYL